MTGPVVFLAAAGLAGLLALGLSRALSRDRSARKRLLKTAPGKTRAAAPPLARPPVRGSKGLRFQSLQYFLASAGLRISSEAFVLVPLATGASLALVVALLTRTLVPALGTFLMATSLPVIYVLIKQRLLRQKIIMEMPDAIGMIIRSLQVGQSVDAALKEAAAALSGPLGAEITIIYREMAVGLSFEQAFSNFELRHPTLPDVKMFCTAFILQRETGGNLVQILGSLSDTIQKRFTFQRQVRTHTAEARLSALVISLLPLLFAGIAWLVNPDYISKLTGTPLGRFLIYLAMALELAGFLVMRRMAKVNI